MDGNFVAFLRSYFRDRCNRVTFGNFSTPWRVHNQGLPQGGPLMPIIWTLFINDYEISNYNRNFVQLTAFADDLTMYILPHKYNSESIFRLQYEIDNLYDYTRKWKLVINAAKCSTISFTRTQNMKAHVYHVNDEPLECIHHPHNAPDICTHSKKKEHKTLAKQHNTKTDANFNNNPTNQEILTPSPCRLLVNDPHTIPLWVRILGLFFDTHLSWKQHVNQIVNRVKHKLFQLQRIAYCKRFNLSPRVIWKLYLSTIRPVIEYGLSIYGSNNNIQELEKLQQRALRIAFRAKKSTNQLYLNHSFQVQTLQQRMDIIRAKYWAKTMRAHPSQLTHQALNQWRNFTSRTDHQTDPYNLRSQSQQPAIRISFPQGSYLAQSPLSKAYQTIDSITPAEIDIPLFYASQYFRSPPCYTTQFPTTFTLYDSYDTYLSEFTDLDTSTQLHAWTDGSCKPNPGPGGCAVVFPELNDELSSDFYFNFETTINHAEIVAIKLAFERIVNNLELLTNYDSIYIFTDSLFCFRFFSGDSYPSLRLYYDVLMEIFDLINQIKEQFEICFVKVESHTNIEFNDQVDIRAKEAAEQAIALQDGGDSQMEQDWMSHRTPAIVDIQKYTSSIRNHYNNIQQQQFEKVFKQFNDPSQEMTHSWKDYILVQSLFYDNGEFRSNSSKLFKSELNHLNGFDIELIMKLRTEHISLMGYSKHILGHISGDCPSCGVTETVTHFICDCMNFQLQRDDMRTQLARIDNLFNDEQFFDNIQHILFPHTWVELPDPDDEEYKEKWKDATKKRASILRIVCQYVKNTNRFYGYEII